MNNRNIKIILFVIILILLFVLGYKFFKTEDTVIIDNPPINENDNKEKDLNKGTKIYDDIYLNFENNKNILNMSNIDDYIIFTLNGTNNSNNKIYYEIKLRYEDNKDSDNNKLIFNLIELNNNEIKNSIELGSFNSINDMIIYSDEITELSVNKKYKLEVIKSDTNISYKNIVVDINISNEKKELQRMASQIVLSEITLHPNTTWTDSDGVIYFSGSNNNVNYNYLWYSGKLWRITCIYPDGTIKLITDNMMTTIAWGKNIEFNGSWVYQWLNEDFYDTLYNPSNLLVLDGDWNYTVDGSRIPNKPNILSNQKVVKAPIGLISSYEYYIAGKNSNSANYLDLGHRWWHLTPQGNMSIRSTEIDGNQDLNERHPAKYERGIRPMIYLNKNVSLTGSGTKNNPYRIVGDIKNANSGEMLNTRISGEYVLFDNDLYRIIDIYDNHTKLMRVDYLRDSSNKKIEKHISRTIVYGSSSNTQSDEWWDNYLINIWYPSISNNYRNMIVPGTYYMGEYSNNTHYKNTICTNQNLDIIKTKDCNKYNDNNHVYVGNVGLIRIGEMFSAQHLDFESYPPSMWTISPFDYQENRIIHESNTLWRHKTWGGFHVVHPTIYLKENIKIISGNGMSNNPFIISE